MTFVIITNISYTTKQNRTGFCGIANNVDITNIMKNNYCCMTRNKFYYFYTKNIFISYYNRPAGFSQQLRQQT